MSNGRPAVETARRCGAHSDCGGFRGCLGVVSEWSARRKRAEKADPATLTRAPSARTIARLLTVGRERLSKAETLTVAAIERGVTVLV